MACRKTMAPWKAAFAIPHCNEPAAQRLRPPYPRYEKGGIGIPPASIKRPNHPVVNPLPNILLVELAKELVSLTSVAIAIDTYELNLEEKTRETIHDSQYIMIFCIDYDGRFPTIWHICWIYNGANGARVI